MNRIDKDAIARWLPRFALGGLALLTLFFWPTPALLLAPAVLWLARSRIPFSILSPVWVIIIFLTAVGLVGYGIYGLDSANVDQLFQLDGEVTRDTVLIIAASTLIMTLGALAYSFCRPPLAGSGIAQLEVSNRWARVAAIVIACLPLLVGLLVLDSLYSRTTYLGAEGSIQGGLGMLTLGGMMALGYLFRISKPGARVAVIAAIAIEFVILFSLGSRQFAMAPTAIAFGAYIGKSDRLGLHILLGSAVVSLLLLPIPLNLRVMPGDHGLGPYLSNLTSIPYGWTSLKDAVGNLTIGFPVTGIAAFESDHIGFDKILISLNPMFGRAAGWYEISDQLRITPIFPFSGIGELWNSGATLAVALLFVLGVVIGHIDYRTRQLMIEGRRIVAVVLFGLAVLFGLLMSSYNLRNSTRPLWYAIGIDLVTRIPIGRVISPGSGTRRLRLKKRSAGGEPGKDTNEG